ncbi:MAG TPA: hypothetical protein VFB34_06340 [Chloroflexota bacterium]|nr:hypothetical protein [Chloroflexota bacterium]
MRLRAILTVAACSLGVVAANGTASAGANRTSSPWGPHGPMTNYCASPRGLCMELSHIEKRRTYGNKYVGHDEPSLLFYSHQPGSGNQMRYTLTLPRDPSYAPKLNRSWNFELQPAFWFGMAMCASKSYPEVKRSCKPDSDSNIQPPGRHAGTAYMELQFYPPGNVPQPTGFSCSLTRWCAALTIDSYAYDPIHNVTLNSHCANAIGGIEYVNFAYLTRNGRSTVPANPIQAGSAVFNIDPKRDLFMNPGDRIQVTLHDVYTLKRVNGRVLDNTPSDGLQTVVTDLTTHQSGSMTASKRNGFGQITFAPDPSVECKLVPYNFHPMYSTSTPNTTVPWAAHTYNVAFSGEIGHLDLCYPVLFSALETISPGGACPGDFLEGQGSDYSYSDVDDYGCFGQGYFGPKTLALPASLEGPTGSQLTPFGGCLGANDPGFDGPSYQKLWPDGNPNHAGPTYFSSPLSGGKYNTNYQQVGFQTDLPAVEPYPYCNFLTGAGCSLLPTTDDEAQAAFYPFYSSGSVQGHCMWSLGNDIPGFTRNDYGRNSQYGPLLPQVYLNPGGGLVHEFDNFSRTLPNNPCPAG